MYSIFRMNIGYNYWVMVTAMTHFNTNLVISLSLFIAVYNYGISKGNTKAKRYALRSTRAPYTFTICVRCCSKVTKLVKVLLDCPSMFIVEDPYLVNIYD